jgi:hypothetical protein
MGRMKTTRQYNHLIDLEYFCHRDSDADRNELHRRDRTIFLDNREQLNHQAEPANRDLIRLWLSCRRQQEFPGPERKSPGTIFGDVYLFARNLAVIKGILVGLLAGFSFFTYTGTTPVNVFHFLLLFVVSQLTFAAFLLAACLVRPLLPRLKLPSFYSLLFRGMLGRLVAFLHKQWLHKMAAGQRASVSHAFGLIKARSTVYGTLFYWPLFALSQLFAIGFNLGLLAATLVKISTSDLAFGWQSTMQFGAEAIHRAVAFAALPWSWFVPRADSYPSLAEIEGSRIILKEGIYHLTTGDLIAWWPFLIFCLLFYGFFLRLILLFAGKIMETFALRKLKFDTPACLAVVRRMQTPLVSTQAAPETTEPQPESHAPPRSGIPVPPASGLLPQTVLIPDDIFALCPVEQLQPLLRERGLAIKDVHRFMISYDHDRQLLELLADRQWQPGEGLFILMEGWMVPLVDFLSYVKKLRKLLPTDGIIHVGLVGRPETTSLTPVAPEDFTIWRQKIEAVGDPYLTIFSLIP